jgi:intracellular sulfur oxidation DsrE/DsrF family protein
MTIALLIHAPTGAALKRGRNNLRNLLKSEPNAKIELVANGEGALQALSTPDPEVDNFLVLCENSLKAANLVAPAEIRTVKTAILHIALRQSEGWGYFRA